ncbi:YciI family protein [Phytoactinopolyspora halotolerans]|uniref:YCII-related domain-containing protein n=1 Tax=Phytoactinopolyspora halotolerans TaxID=1981512 RepID=A0A6L9S1U1_9ACTN|nr:YciI family protein [Phytoactinopolyspora halotolerans]NED98780.1 hypothetical protein [Phytoactinopolyspora halotolerans]
MKYMLLMTYGVPADVDEKHGEISTWPPEDIKAHHQFQRDMNQELVDSGELADAQGLASPEQAKIVRFAGHGAPVVTDGPFPESKELLAGYRIVDVESEQRAIDIAAKMSAAPGRGGEPLNLPIEVRQVMSAPDVDV